MTSPESCRFPEAAIGGVLEKVFLGISQKKAEVCNFIKKETLAHKRTFFTEHFRATASGFLDFQINICLVVGKW